MLFAGCTLSLASVAAVAVPCKSGQKAVHKGSTVCVPASSAKAKAPTKATKPMAKTKATVKSRATTKSKITTKSRKAANARTKATAKTKGKLQSRAIAGTQGEVKTLAITASPFVANEVPVSTAPIDCDSTQSYLQGGSAQCGVPAVANGAGASSQLVANPGTACFAALAASQASRRLSPHVPFLSASAASAEALANMATPNTNERKVLGGVIIGYGMCLDMAAAWRKQAYAPVVGSALDAYWHDAQGILNALAAGKRTFGDAARAIADTDKAYKIRINTLERVANLPAAHSAQ